MKGKDAIGLKLEDDDRANGLTEDWAEVERVCRRHDMMACYHRKKRARCGVVPFGAGSLREWKPPVRIITKTEEELVLKDEG